MLQQIFSLSFMTAFLAAAVRLAVPLMYGGIGETIAEKSGILNIGMEGVMLSGAFFSFAGAWYSGNLFVGLLCGMAGGLVVSLLHGLLSITLIQIIPGNGKALIFYKKFAASSGNIKKLRKSMGMRNAGPVLFVSGG